MTNCWRPYKQVPEDYKVTSIFATNKDDVSDYNSISIFKKLYNESLLTNGIIKDLKTFLKKF